MKTEEFEKDLWRHADSIKKNAAVSFFYHYESEDLKMNQKHLGRRMVLIAAAVLCLLSTTVFAAFYLSADEAARRLGDTKLAAYFEDVGTISETVSDGDFAATLLGVASGENLSSFVSSSWDLFPERTYAVVAIERTNGSPMTFDDNLLVTPLIEGLNPGLYNIFTMNGSYHADVIDGVLYRVVEFDSIEYFSDRSIYIAVMSESFYDSSAYTFDEESGAIAAAKDFAGTNILIEVKTDPAKADPAKADEYLEKLNNAIYGE